MAASEWRVVKSQKAQGPRFESCPGHCTLARKTGLHDMKGSHIGLGKEAHIARLQKAGHSQRHVGFGIESHGYIPMRKGAEDSTFAARTTRTLNLDMSDGPG